MYQLKDFFSLFYLRFVNGKQPNPGGWNAIHGTSSFYSWAGDTFELLCIEHLPCIINKLRIPSVDRHYCWSGKTPDGKGAQVDLVLESKSAATDYLCEMKFSAGKYLISANEADNMLHKIDAFANSKMHNKSRSIQLVMVAANGLAQGYHASIVNNVITMDDLF